MADDTTTKNVVIDLGVHAQPDMAKPLGELGEAATQAGRKVKDFSQTSLQSLRGLDRGILHTAHGFATLGSLFGAQNENFAKTFVTIQRIHSVFMLLRGGMELFRTLQARTTATTLGQAAANDKLAASATRAAVAQKALGAAGGPGGAAAGGGFLSGPGLPIMLGIGTGVGLMVGLLEGLSHTSEKQLQATRDSLRHLNTQMAMSRLGFASEDMEKRFGHRYALMHPHEEAGRRNMQEQFKLMSQVRAMQQIGPRTEFEPFRELKLMVQQQQDIMAHRMHLVPGFAGGGGARGGGGGAATSPFEQAMQALAAKQGIHLPQQFNLEGAGNLDPALGRHLGFGGIGGDIQRAIQHSGMPLGQAKANVGKQFNLAPFGMDLGSLRAAAARPDVTGGGPGAGGYDQARAAALARVQQGIQAETANLIKKAMRPGVETERHASVARDMVNYQAARVAGLQAQIAQVEGRRATGGGPEGVLRHRRLQEELDHAEELRAAHLGEFAGVAGVSPAMRRQTERLLSRMMPAHQTEILRDRAGQRVLGKRAGQLMIREPEAIRKEMEGIVPTMKQVEALQKELLAAQKEYTQSLLEQHNVERTAGKEKIENLKKVLGLVQQEEQAARNAVRAAESAYQSTKEYLGGLSPMEKRGVIHLAKRLKSGQTLNPEEMKGAKKYAPALGRLMREYHSREADKDPLTAIALKEAGAEEDITQAKKVLEFYSKAVVEIQNKVTMEVGNNEKTWQQAMLNSIVPQLQQQYNIIFQQIQMAMQKVQGEQVKDAAAKAANRRAPLP